MTEFVFLVLLFVGVTVLFLPELRDLKRIVSVYMRKRIGEFRNDDWENLRRERFREKILEHLRLLLQAGFSMGTRKSVHVFLILSGLCGAGFFLVTAGRISLLLVLPVTGVGFLLPYLFLRCIVQGKQVAGSQEGEIMVTELLNHYKIHYCNMIHAVEQTALTMEGAPYCRRLLFNLSRGLNKISGEMELRQLLDEFQMSLGTFWAGILSANIFLACDSGIDVTESLSDLAQSMKRARNVEEFLHRENNEVRIILKYLVPGSWLVLTIGGIFFFGLSAEEWFYYQFRTDAGTAWFSLTLLVYAAAVGMYLLFSVRKFDL